MNAIAWKRLFIPLLLTLIVASSAAAGARLALDPHHLPRGEADLTRLQQELERLSAGRDTPRLVSARPGEGVRFDGLDDLDGLAQGLVGDRDPFALPLFDGASRVALLGPTAAVRRARAVLAERADQRGITLSPLPIEDDALPARASLDAIDVALVLALPALDADRQRRLFARLRDAGIPSLALTDAGQVTRGALLSVPGALDREAYLRHLALRLDDIALGRRPEPLGTPPTLSRSWLNLETAAHLDWTPSFDLLSRSRLVAAPAPVTARGAGVGLDQAVALALADNIGLAVSRQEVEIQAFEQDLAASRYRPTLYLEATGRQIDDTRARVALGQEPERLTTGSAVLEQLLFSEPALASIAITESLDRARRAELEAESLDLALSVASDFLDLLRLDARREVLEADLDLARAQRDMAARGASAGAVSRGELARFEAELAQARERREQVVADQARARLALNRALGRAPSAALSLEPPDLEATRWLGGDERFLALLETPESLARWQRGLTRRALADSRQLEALSALRQAAVRELASRRRAFWLPDIGLEARYTTELARGGEGDQAPWESSNPLVQGIVGVVERVGVPLPATGQDEWSVGVSARLPLYAGGRRSIELDRSAARLEKVALQDADARQGLETRLRATTVELLASWRRIGLRRDARDYTQEALTLAEAAWREGALAQVALLDARTAARQAGLAAAEARWQALQALVHLQRSLGMTPGPMDEAERARLLAPDPS